MTSTPIAPAKRVEGVLRRRIDIVARDKIVRVALEDDYPPLPCRGASRCKARYRHLIGDFATAMDHVRFRKCKMARSEAASRFFRGLPT